MVLSYTIAVVLIFVVYKCLNLCFCRIDLKVEYNTINICICGLKPSTILLPAAFICKILIFLGIENTCEIKD